MPIIDIEDEQKLRRLCSVVYSRFSGAWLSKRARSAPVLGRREDKGAEALALAVDVHSYCQCAFLYSDFPPNEIVSRIRRTRMINKHICTLGWAAAFAVTTVSAAAAAPFDGNWNVIVYTTNGHCGITNWQVGIAGGQVYSAGAMLGGYPAGLGGGRRTIGSGAVQWRSRPAKRERRRAVCDESRERNLGRSGPLGQMLRGVERNSGVTG
jgi:hypothetical protein